MLNQKWNRARAEVRATLEVTIINRGGDTRSLPSVSQHKVWGETLTICYLIVEKCYF